MECNNQRSNSKGHEKYLIDCLEAHIAICTQISLREEIARKFTDSWTKGTKQNYHWMLVPLATVKRPSDLNLLRIAPGVMQITEDSFTFRPVFGAKNAHIYGPIVSLRQAEDACLCPVRLIKEYIAKTKDREDQREKLFVPRKMGPAVTVSSGLIASWLKETLTLANIRASGGSKRKATVTYVGSQRASVRTIMEASDWAHTSTMYGHYIRCLPKVVLVRIVKQTSASIQGVNVAKIATDNPC